MRILVVNPNTNAATTAMLVEAARGTIAGTAWATEATVVGATAATGPTMIVDPVALANAVQPTVQAAMVGLAHQPDAVVVAAFGDPGAVELRETLAVPVVGIGEAAMRRAADSGQRFAIVTSTPQLREPIQDLIRMHCPTADFAGMFFTRTSPLELAANPRRNVEELDAGIDEAVAAGATAVVIGGGPLTDAARELAMRSDVLVIEPVPCAVERALDLACLPSLGHGTARR